MYQERTNQAPEPLPLPTDRVFEDEIIVRHLLARLCQKLTEKQTRILTFWLAGYAEKEIGAVERVSREAIHQQKTRMTQIAAGMLADA